VNTKRSSYSLLYAVVLGVVCALALTAVDHATQERKAANAKAEEVRNILGVLGVPFDAKATSEELLKIYADKVTQEKQGSLTFYVYDNPKAGKLYATRFSGPGLWGPVEGFLCLEGDMRTIYAISFYKQEETPGLGGEISSKSFESQFHGKSIVNEQGKPGISIVARAEGISQVDGITGATMTGDKVQDMLNSLIDQIVNGDGGRGRNQ
jgi:Na+-transporting NADH:ubiquinone oxidoreductase subunit C